MKLLAIDIGSSSVKAAVLSGAGNPQLVAREPFTTSYDGTRAQVDEREISRALVKTISKLGAQARRADAIVATTMAPSWLAMDAHGRAITPIVTHQDRRSVAEARQLEKAVGRARHLRLAGNRPFPGGISSTTWRWFVKNEKSLMRRADLVGHLSTWLLRRFCGTRVTDPSNAAFMGVYGIQKIAGWSDELLAAVGGRASQLPEIREANVIAGHITRAAAGEYGLVHGTPVLTGCIDGSAGMLATAGRHGHLPPIGQVLNVSGSTDVLAVLVDRPRPHEQLLTRPLGVGDRWLAVGTLAAAGSALEWARKTLYADMSESRFYRHLATVSLSAPTGLEFRPDLAGSRTSMDQLSGELRGLRLSSTRDQILAALCDGLATASGQRLARLVSQYGSLKREIAISGGVPPAVTSVIRRDWKLHGRWRFSVIQNATLRGLWNLAHL